MNVIHEATAVVSLFPTIANAINFVAVIVIINYYFY